MSYQLISPILNSKLEELVTSNEIGIVYAYPESKIESFPAIVFYPVRVDSSFHSNEQNEKTYRYVIAIVQEASTAKPKEIYLDLMPAAVDAVLAKLDEKWDFGTNDGARVWLEVVNGDWVFAEESPDGPSVTAFIFVNIRLLNNI